VSTAVVALGVFLAAVLSWRPGAADRLPALVRRGPGRTRARSRPQPVRSGAPLLMDLVASAVASGAAPTWALAVVAAAVGGVDGAELARVADRLRLGAPPARAWEGSPPHLAPLRRALELSEASGAPVAGLLREAAEEQRREHQREAVVAASRLGVRVVLPLGLCALPGFALLGVAPVVLGLAGQLLRG
jgi:pilus assembly protein TadC